MELFNPKPAYLGRFPQPAIFDVEAAKKSKASVADSAVEGDLTPGVLTDLTSSFGEAVAFDRGGRLHFLFSRPEAVHEILISQAQAFLKGEQEQALAAAVGWGLLTHEGETHKAVQTALNPSVRGKILSHYLKTTSRMAGHKVALLRGSTVSLVAASREFSQDVTEASLFGLETPTGFYDYHRAVWANNAFMQSQITSAVASNEFRQNRISFQQNKALADQHVLGLIEGWKERGKPGGNFLEYLFAGQEFLADSSDPIREEASIFLQAGTETTASLISWVILLLSSNPGYWSLLRDESQEMGSYSYDSLKDFKLLQAVVKEALRLYPPIWLIPRVATTNVQVSRVQIPEGARVLVSPWVTQRQQEFYEDPLVFRPERWLSEEQEKVRAAYFPFGLGRRVCIGEAFGKMTALTFLMELLRSGSEVEIDATDLHPHMTSLISYPNEHLLARWL